MPTLTSGAYPNLGNNRGRGCEKKRDECERKGLLSLLDIERDGGDLRIRDNFGRGLAV